MQFIARRSSKAAAINLTPMIDMMFLLVLFVFLSARFEPEGGLSVDLPKGQSRETPQKSRLLELVVMHNGILYLQKQPVRIDQLAERIRAARVDQSDPILVISADKDVPYQQVVVVMDCAKLAGQSKMNLKIKP